VIMPAEPHSPTRGARLALTRKAMPPGKKLSEAGPGASLGVDSQALSGAIAAVLVLSEI